MNYSSIVHATDLERETGLGKDLLRKWRSRYGFPQPLTAGAQGYPKEQVDQLRLIKRLLDAGFRPALIVGKPLPDLEKLAQAIGCADACLQWQASTRRAIDLLKQADLVGLAALLTEESRRQSITEFVLLTVAPLTTAIGEAWVRGEIEVYHEHLCTGLLQRQLHAAIGAAVRQPDRPRIIFATPPDELHCLGLLMAQAVLADHGVDCVNVGPHIGAEDLARAAQACRADIVALSFSFAYPRRRVRPFLAHLRSLLPDATEVWAGGAATADIVSSPKGIHIFADLRQAAASLSTRGQPINRHHTGSPCLE